MKKRVLCLLTACLLLLGCAPALAAPQFADELPADCYRVQPTRGTVERIAYPTRDYLGGGEEITKYAVVYLPAGYDPACRYNLMVLCHGVGGTEDEWGFMKPYNVGNNILDYLANSGQITPFIVVMPNGRSCAKYNDTSMNNASAFYAFGKELRNDLLPWIDAHYATYGADTPDDLTASREHRAMAGLSMGGMQTINIGLCECLDLFAWFGAFSAAPTSYEDTKIAAALEKFPDLPIRYFYSICGLNDNLYFAGSAAAKEICAVTDRLTEENWHWQERSGGHDFGIWNLGLYNFARLFGAAE